MVKGAEDFINGNWRGSNGHETGQWSAQGGWSTLASCRPHFLFLVLSSMVSCEHPRSCSVCPTIFETLTDSMPLLHGYSAPARQSLSNEIYTCSRPISHGDHGGEGGGRRRRRGRERESLRKIFSSCENGHHSLAPTWKLGKRRWKRFSKINECTL